MKYHYIFTIVLLVVSTLFGCFTTDIFASDKAGDIIKDCKYSISDKATWEGDCIVALDEKGLLDRFPYKDGVFTTLDNNYRIQSVIVLNLSNKIGLKFFPNRDTVELVDIDATEFIDLANKGVSNCVTFRESISFDSWVKTGGNIEFLKKYNLLPSSETERKLRKINRNNFENYVFSRKLMAAGQSLSNSEKFALMLASAGIAMAGVSVMTRGLLNMTGATGSIGSSSSCVAKSCGNVHVKFSGQWFLGTIKSVTVELINRDSQNKYTEAGSWDSVDFFELPFGKYEFVINAFEQSGLSGQQHTLKGNFSHNCKSNQIYIDAGGGFVDPSINIYCN
ncbi:MAG: hypothetical protein KKH66_18310 [Proteobacteria bacterium]|nr:hypothetical protein [Pseudomonadota bacterium]MBU4606867.1 hypothetical protein [Pseudomonadota bacterium]MCG2766460.1 hypothetical protein [Desulfarculaceae bacterium]